MTGCFALLNKWRGATEVYPEEVAGHFASSGEFVERIGELVQQHEQGDLPMLSKEVSEKAVSRYGHMEMYDKMAEVVEQTYAATLEEPTDEEDSQ
jgi:hypothetical protein